MKLKQNKKPSAGKYNAGEAENENPTTMANAAQRLGLVTYNKGCHRMRFDPTRKKMGGS